MTIERALRLVAGLVVLASVALAVFHSPFWLLVTVLVALNLLQSAFTNWCPMVWVLAKLGLPRCMPSSHAPDTIHRRSPWESPPA